MSGSNISSHADSRTSKTGFIPLNNQVKTTVQTSNEKNGADNPVVAKVPVTLENKPPQIPLGEHLTRQALNKLSSVYNLSAADVELEIQYIKEKDGGKFIDDLSFGKTAVKNPNDLTDLQVSDLIKNGHKNVEFGIHQATVERMVKRDELVKWLAQKDEFGIAVSDQDKADLAQLGYTTDDLAKFRDAKYMYYQGYRSQARAESETRFKTLNDELRQKMVAEQMAKLELRPDSDFYEEGNEKINPDLERRRLANAAVNNLLGGKTPFEYERDKSAEESFEKRLAGKSYGEYLSSGSKSLINSFYYSIGDALKGVAVLANGISRYDEFGNRLERKASDAPVYKFGDWIQQNVQAPNVDKDIEKTFFGGTVPKTVGGFLPYLLGGWATSAPKATVAIYAGLSTGGNIYDEAKRSGANESQAQKAGLLTGGFVGVTSVFGYGKTLEALNSGAGAATWQTIFSEAIKDGGRNAIIAGGQTVFENGVAKQTYDSNRSYLENVRERMIAAGITGATLKGGLEIIAKVRMGSNPQVLAETQKIFKIKPEIETSTPKQIELKNSGDAKRAELDAKLKRNNLDNSKIELTQKSYLKGRIEEITAPASGKSVKVYTDGKTIVPIDKVEKYVRGKVDVDIQSVSKELRDLKQFRNSQRKLFDADPKNAIQIEHLEKMKHNFERSDNMRKTLESIGLADTPSNNQIIADHLLKIGKNITSDNRLDFPSIFEGPKGKIKILSTWTIVDGKPYLSTIKLIPINK
jgi:hypothetical protein